MKEIFETTSCLSFDQIKLYVQGKLNSKEQYKVEEHLSDCELCSDALEGYASTNNLQQAETILEKTTWPSKDQKEDSTPAKVIPISKERHITPMFLKVAAVLIGLIGSLALFSILSSENSNYDNLIVASLPVYDASSRNDSAAISTEPFYKALQLFDRKAYTESSSLFQQHLTGNPQDKAAIFFQGVAFLKSGQTNKAIKNLEQVYLDRTSGYYLDATWFLALAKLKKGDKTRAKSLLMTLSQVGNYYNKRASELLIVLE